MHRGRASHRDLVDAVLELAALAEDRVDLLRVERALRRVDVDRRHISLAAAGLLDLDEDLAHGPGEPGLIPHPPDVHEHDLGTVPEEVIVQRRDLEPAVERDAHDGIHLVFEQDHVPHDDNVLAGPLERGP